ncbi:MULTISPECIES: type II secretion system F family protein [unclassified Crossiella]|uniref:type II secretion system F family protein n=1 Tax=unclassified Crossiella TaxID=2620835 RepID=UPI001FFF3C93|nr:MULTISPECIES: type II secretion system F family protein [unclassified Crossiella]MCK2241866.1 type II secretion system F family protein [Crossiella sp. S99.2]MCK2255769.1 type II secretion system F family protein [Crossiella sp. S99.1]
MTALPAVLGVALATAVLLAATSLRAPAPPAERGGSGRRGWNAWVWGRRWARPRATLSAVVAGGLVWWVSGWPVAAVAAAIGVVLVPRAVAQPGNRGMIATLEALAEWIRRVADLLGSGAGGLESALTASARTAPAPIAEHVQALAARTRAGGTEPALWAFARDLDHAAAHRVVACLLLRLRSGGRGLLPILTELAQSLRQDVAARREVEADRAKIRTSVRALLGIIAAMTAALSVFTEDYLTPFDTLVGQLWLALALGFLALACVWLATLTRPRPEPGFLLHRPRFLGRTPRRWTP